MGVSGGLVSVVMPAFEAEAFIAEAVASVLSQTYSPVELIVVDDGSSDRTAEIANLPSVLVIRRDHRGPASARNAGLAVAQGEYWTIFDADDVMPVERLAHQVACLDGDPSLGIVTGLTEAFVTPGEPRPPHYNPVWSVGAYRGHPGTILARREVLDRVGSFDEELRLAEDVDWLTRAHDAGVSIGHVDELCLRYRIHRRNTSSDTRANQTATISALRSAVRRRRG